MTLPERAEIAFPFFNKLSEISRLQLGTDARIMSVKKRTELLKRGDRVDGAYLVLAGQLDVYTVNAAGREATLYRIRRGETCLFALNSVFSGVAYPAWVRVVSDAAVLLIPGRLVRELHEREAPFRTWAFGVQCQRIFDLVSAFEEAQTLSLGERICSYLARASNGRNEVVETHEDLAAYLGTAREVVSRHLNLLAERNLIKLSRGRITILDARKLRPDLFSKRLPAN